MKFTTLSIHHASQLLDFELKNKEWFDSLIEPRAVGFYSEKGITEHINTLLKQMNTGVAYCGLLLKGNTIVARANIRDVTKNSASIGYRVAKDFTSQGVASYCLSQLLEIGQNKLYLKQVKAQVLENNPASKRVLEKFGFQIINTTPNFLTINNKWLSCTEYCFDYKK